MSCAHHATLRAASAFRGGGLSRLLLDRDSVDARAQAGFTAITLTVTKGNAEAVELYRSFGFTTRHRFDAMVMDTPRYPSRWASTDNASGPPGPATGAYRPDQQTQRGSAN